MRCTASDLIRFFFSLQTGQLTRLSAPPRLSSIYVARVSWQKGVISSVSSVAVRTVGGLRHRINSPGWGKAALHHRVTFISDLTRGIQNGFS